MVVHIARFRETSHRLINRFYTRLGLHQRVWYAASLCKRLGVEQIAVNLVTARDPNLLDTGATYIPRATRISLPSFANRENA